jgi:hypothetical protein
MKFKHDCDGKRYRGSIFVTIYWDQELEGWILKIKPSHFSFHVTLPIYNCPYCGDKLERIKDE